MRRLNGELSNQMSRKLKEIKTSPYAQILQITDSAISGNVNPQLQQRLGELENGVNRIMDLRFMGLSRNSAAESTHKLHQSQSKPQSNFCNSVSYQRESSVDSLHSN